MKASKERIRQAAEILADSRTEADGWEPLISAAPEMLAWIKAFVAVLVYHDAEVKLSFQGSALNGDILDAIRDASKLLTKIEGGK